MERKEIKNFAVERMINTGHDLQFYEHMEICFVEKGTAFIVISGEGKYLSEGQIAIINPFENCSVENMGECSILIVSVGTSYLRYFLSLYPDRKLPRWLMYAKFNGGLFGEIRNCPNDMPGEQNELGMTSIVCGFSSMSTFYRCYRRYLGSKKSGNGDVFEKPNQMQVMEKSG